MSTEHHRPITVGVDGSEPSMVAVQWAAAEAARLHAPLELLNSTGVPLDYPPTIEYLPNEAERYRHEGTQILAKATKLATDLWPPDRAPEITARVVDGPPIPTLIARSKEARMVVVGTSGMGALGRGLLGSVSTSIARHAHCPVAVIPPTAPDAPDRSAQPVVVGVDGSPSSVRAVAIAFEEASNRGVGLVAVHTWSEFFRYNSRVEMQQEDEELLAECLAGYADQYPDVPVRRVVVEERPAHCLLAEAAHAQLIVLGSHGRGGFAGMTLGSVSQAVLHAVHIPIIIVRTK
ncbi:universal stress protein [Nocardia brasiliensis]|uniref:universal stress protein n=1 Tax=Nocardia brasiliensis TaxID=37326 RepID=UPI00189625CF|nr:universal stress protein [Nocardia brasiliensis]MBF6542396.1 universal stress protein [Nocardia brasiliensis]